MNQHIREDAPGAGRLLFLLFRAAFIFSLLIAGMACSPRSGQRGPEDIIFVSDDGFTLSAALYAPQAQAPPGLILAHRYGDDRSVWNGFAEAARGWGVMTLALDLRGHGDSRMRDGERIQYRQIPDWRAGLRDIRAAKSALLAHGADPNNLAVAGEGLGANLALLYALEDPDMQAVVMLSPGLDYQGVEIEKAMGTLQDCPSLLMTSEGDSYAAMSANALHAAAPVFSELRAWPGAAHGTDLFASRPEAIRFVLHWLQKIIAPDTPNVGEE